MLFENMFFFVLMSLGLKLHKCLLRKYIMYFFIQITLTIIISILIIYSCHLLFDQFKNNYSVKKTKDLVNIHNAKYKKMFEDIQSSKKNGSSFEKTSLDVNDIQKLNEDLELFINAQTQSNESL